MKKIFEKQALVILIMAMVIISVSLDSLQASAATKKPTKITINAKSKTLTVGKSFQLKVKSVKPTKASKAVTYKSSKKSVATVSSKGKIVAKKAGKTTITVTSKANKKVKATCIVTVKKKSDISKVKNPVVSNGKITYTRIYFGHYPQSDVAGKKMDKIKWRVLSVKGNDAFLVADQNLDVMPYNKTMRNVTWETCTMRSWLNGYGSSANVCGIDYRNENFIDKAFSEKEQAAIYTANVVNKDDAEFGNRGRKEYER